MVTLAAESDIHQVKALWKDCFGDEDSYIELFFSRIDFNKDNNRILIIKDHDSIVSMAFLLESTVYAGGVPYSAYYLFAVATLPQLRGRGYATIIEQYAKDTALLHNKCYLTLVPQTPSLFEFYKAIGYDTAFFLTKTTLHYAQISHSLTPILLTRLSKEEFVSYRKECIRSIPYSCGFADINAGFVYDDLRYSGIECYSVEYRDTKGYICTSVEGDTLIIHDTLTTLDQIKTLLPSLLQHFNCRSLSITYYNKAQNTIPYGMVKRIDDTAPQISDGYMNLMLL